MGRAPEAGVRTIYDQDPVSPPRPSTRRTEFRSSNNYLHYTDEHKQWIEGIWVEILRKMAAPVLQQSFHGSRR